MSITPPALASLTRVKRRVVKLLNLTDDNSPDSTDPDEMSKFTPVAIRDACFEGESIGVCHPIIETVGHPYRSQFIGDDYDSIANGGLIPPHVSDLDIVLIGTGETFERGQLAMSLDRLLQIAKLPDLYGTPLLYWPDGGNRLRFIGGDEARIYRPSYIVDRTSNAGAGALQAPEVYERGVIAHALTGLYMDGGDGEAANWYGKQAEMMTARIRGKETSLPDVEALRRAAA